MSTENPFAGKFKVDTDQDDYIEIKTTTKQKEQTNETDTKKKKKVRPEKKEHEEVKTGKDEEGFEVVSKHKQTKPKEIKGEERVHKEYRLKKEEKGERGNYRGKRGKREYERRSGTGRGREVAKRGAGGKFTWVSNYNNQYEDNNDDYVFEQALNPKPKEQNEHKEEQKDQQNEEQQNEEQNEQNEEPKEEQKEEHKDNRKRKPKKEETEIPEAERLNIPENPISVADILKNKPTQEEVKYERPADSMKLQFKVKEEHYDLGTTQQAKKEKKKKEKKGNQGKELIQEFGGFEDNYAKKNWKYQKQQKFKFNASDFPSNK